MAAAEDYAKWIVGNSDKKGTPEFDTVAKAYQAARTQMPEKSIPSDAVVAESSINKGIAGIPDAVLNTPNRVINLGKALFGTGATLAGRPDLAPVTTPDPNYVHKGFEAAGLIRADPQNARQRVIDAAVQGGVGGLANPASGVGRALANTVVGATAGGVGDAVGEVTKSEPLAIAASMAVPAAAARMNSAKPINEVKAKTLQDAEAAGYIVPPSEKNPSFVNKRLESIAGKEATRQEVRIRNQNVTNQSAATELGFPADTAITEKLLNGYRDAVAQPYREVSALSPTAASALEELKQARYDAKVYGRHADMSGDPESVKRADQAAKDAKTWEGVILQEAQRVGPTKLVEDLKAARQQIAKAYDIERALNLGSADISLPSLGRAYDRGAPLSGNLEAGAKFQQAYPLYTAEGQRQPTPGVSKAEAITSAILGTMGAASMGPHGLAAAGLPFISGPTRSLVLSKPYQKMMTGGSRVAPDEEALRSLMIARAVADRKGAQQ